MSTCDIISHSESVIRYWSLISPNSLMEGEICTVYLLCYFDLNFEVMYKLLFTMIIEISVHICDVVHSLTAVTIAIGVGSNFIFGRPNKIYSDLRCMCEY